MEELHICVVTHIINKLRYTTPKNPNHKMPPPTYTVEKQYPQKAAFAMKRHGPHGKNRIGLTLAGIGAAMLIALLLPWWFWWIAIAIGFLCGGIWLLKR